MRCVSYDSYVLRVHFRLLKLFNVSLLQGSICTSLLPLACCVSFYSIALLLVEFFRTLHIYSKSLEEKYKALFLLWKPYCSMRLGNYVSLSYPQSSTSGPKNKCLGMPPHKALQPEGKQCSKCLYFVVRPTVEPEKFSEFLQVTEPVSGRDRRKTGLPEKQKSLSLLKLQASAFLHGLRKTILRFLGLVKS